MAEEDDAQKTEEPTPKRLQDAIEKGDVPVSQEFKTWFMLMASAVIIAAAGPYVASEITAILAGFMGRMASISSDEGGILEPLAGLVEQVGVIMMIPLGALVVAAIVGNRAQHQGIFTFEKVKPSLDKVSPLSGLKKIFSMRIVLEFFKTAAKLATVSIVIFIIVWPERTQFDAALSFSIPELLAYMSSIALRLIIGVLIVMTFIAGIDFSYQQYEHRKKLRMSKQEIKDEHKQTEGDPHVKSRLRQIRSERARQRMMASVPDADVVVTNPTHYAVALAYKHGEMDVPKVLAKGIDQVALRIREVAGENNVPIVENPPLARALHASVEIEDEVPPEHYKAVAEVIGYVMRLKRAGISSGNSRN